MYNCMNNEWVVVREVGCNMWFQESEVIWFKEVKVKDVKLIFKVCLNFLRV